jgi:hypothetical protein
MTRVKMFHSYERASVVIWTTTPWTIPGEPRDRLLIRMSPTGSMR